MNDKYDVRFVQMHKLLPEQRHFIAQGAWGNIDYSDKRVQGWFNFEKMYVYVDGELVCIPEHVEVFGQSIITEVRAYPAAKLQIAANDAIDGLELDLKDAKRIVMLDVRGDVAVFRQFDDEVLIAWTWNKDATGQWKQIYNPAFVNPGEWFDQSHLVQFQHTALIVEALDAGGVLDEIVNNPEFAHMIVVPEKDREELDPNADDYHVAGNLCVPIDTSDLVSINRCTWHYVAKAKWDKYEDISEPNQADEEELLS